MTGQELGEEAELIDSQCRGTVIAVQANFYQVRLHSDHKTFNSQLPCDQDIPSTLLCTRRSRLKKMGQTVMVGDQVILSDPDWTSGRGAITEVLPRQTELDRPAIANVDQILLIFAVAEPDLDVHQLSRFLVKAESTGLGVTLCLNKCDLVSSEQLDHWQQRCQQWGYAPILISVEQGIVAETGKPLTALQERLQDKITVVAGPSGVGKSSFINQLIPTAHLRVSAVSGKLGRGRHTTRHVELFELPMGGLLADTPGFNHPHLDCLPEALVSYFPEARHRLEIGCCQFSNCLHREEPNCMVRGHWERYQYYLDLLAEVMAEAEKLQEQGEIESGSKSKVKQGGKRHNEPKLEAKKYRRVSRRVQHQDLENLCRDVDFIDLHD